MFAILVGISLKSAAVLAVAWLMAFLLRGRSAAARHLVWTAAAAAILALPLLSMALPSWRVATPQALAPTNVGLVFHVFATAGADGTDAAGRSLGPAEVSTHSGRAGRRAPWQSDWRLWVMALWGLGAAAVLFQLLAAYVRLGRMRTRARAYADCGDFGALADSLGIDGPVALLEGASASMPMTAGICRPVVFLPADAIDWSEERRRVVLLHELAHVRRGDVAAHLMARAALSLNWWNPLAWTAWREFLKESERAADDLVLAAGARPSDYAGHLLEVARSMQTPASAAWAAVAMARRAQLEGRLLAILDSRVRRHAMGRGAPLVAALAAVLLVAPFAAVRAQDQSKPAVPPELDATISVANSQKNHEILEHAASAYESLQKYDAAQTLLENALTIRGEVSGTQSAAYAAGLVKLGDLELKRHKVDEAKAFYTKAVSLGDRPEVAGALVYLGISSMRNERDTARDYFQRAVNVNPTGPEAGAAYTWLAEMQRTETLLEKARGILEGQTTSATETEQLYQKALAVEEPKSVAAANTLHLYARFLQEQDRTSEAEQMETQARGITQATATQFAKIMQGTAGASVNFRVQTTLGPNGYQRPPAGADPTADASSPYAPLVQPTHSPDSIKMASGVSAPVLLYKVEPEYTEEARAAKYQGTVLVYVEVGPNGLAHNMQVVRGLGLGLDEKAIEAVSKWRFKPGQKEGQPVTVQATIEVNFRLL
ncbi:MAG: TonB family protein [Bryobacteraceae bacterium]